MMKINGKKQVENFFLPYGVISKVFRGKYLDELKACGMILSLNFMVQQRNIRTAIVLKNFLISVMKRTGSLTVKKLSMVHSRLSIILENIPTG